MRIAVIFVAILLALSATAQARAESITFRVQAFHQNVVDVEFYSQNRKAAWPGNGRVYSITDFERHTYKLNCQPGESICYGGWVRGNSSIFWGVGQGNKTRCRNCCYTCDGGVNDVTMNR